MDAMGIRNVMSERSGRWDGLEQALLALDDRAMVLEELDGFMAGLLVCPERIPPGEWFARVVGLSKGRPSPFLDLDHANDVLELVMAYYDEVAVTLAQHPERYRPRFSADNDGDELWALWVDGFAAAKNLRNPAFETYLEVEGEVATAAMGMTALIDATRDDEPDPVDDANLGGGAAQTIRDAVLTLHRHRLAAARPLALADHPNPFADAAKVRRNDPCPCGSGRKYKRCCGAN
jgi:uncharacterized protein